MTDIVERLRREGVEFHEQLEAADEIERLREHVSALRLVATAHEPEIERLREQMKTSKPLYEEFWDARKEIERLQDTIRFANKVMDAKDAYNERLRAALAELVEAVTAEVNEKGGGGYILARLSEARRALEPKP